MTPDRPGYTAGHVAGFGMGLIVGVFLAGAAYHLILINYLNLWGR